MHNREFSESKNNAVFKPSKVNAKYYFDLVNHSYPLLFPFFSATTSFLIIKMTIFAIWPFPVVAVIIFVFSLYLTVWENTSYRRRSPFNGKYSIIYSSGVACCEVMPWANSFWKRAWGQLLDLNAASPIIVFQQYLFYCMPHLEIDDV